MILVQTHGWMHRLRQDGIMESAESRWPKNTAPWQQMTPESMEMSGGDYDFIYQSLVRLVEIFRNRIEPMPHSVPMRETESKAERVE